VKGREAPLFYVTDLRHFEGIDFDPDAPRPALRFARYLRRVVLAATASPERGPRPTALPCRRRPQRAPCPGRLVVERQDVPSQINWHCPACGEAGQIDGWQGSEFDLSASSPSDTKKDALADTKRVVLPERSYWFVLDGATLDQECERLLYRGRPVADGVELSGAESDFEELEGYVAFEANNALTNNAERKWEDIFARLQGKPRDWLEHSTDVVLEELSHFGLVAAREHVAGMIRQHIAMLAAALGLTERSLQRQVDDENLRELARQAAIDLAAEQPGADLLSQPRNVPVAFQTVARLMTALAEAAHVRVENGDSVGAHGALQILSLTGQVLYDLPGPPKDVVLFPQAALARGARLLNATAEMLHQGAAVSPDLPSGSEAGLAAAFARDAESLRQLVETHGTPSGPTPGS
jgi:plasmid stabilization system protein ParE